MEEYTNRFGGSPGMDLAVAPASGDSSMGTMMGGGNTKTVTLVADSLDVLEQGADQVADAMSQVPGVIRVANEFDQSRVKGRLVVDSQKAQALGTSESAVAMQVYYLLNGMTATTLDDYGDSDAEYDVVLEYPEGKYDDITTLLDYPIATQSGRMSLCGTSPMWSTLPLCPASPGRTGSTALRSRPPQRIPPSTPRPAPLTARCGA